MSYVQKGKAQSVYIRQNEGSLMDVEHAEMVEKQLDAMIQRRAKLMEATHERSLG
jgi:hypothetical protein